MIVVDLVKSQEKMQLLYHRGEYIVAIKMCLEDFCCGLLLSNSEPGMTLKKKQRNWGLFLNSPAMKIRLLKKVVSSLQYLSGAPHDDFLLNSLKTLFLQLSRVLLDIQKCILSGTIKFVSVRSTQGKLSLFEISRDSVLFSRNVLCIFMY